MYASALQRGILATSAVAAALATFLVIVGVRASDRRGGPRAPFDVALYRGAKLDLRAQGTRAAIDKSVQMWLGTNGAEARAALVRLATDPEGAQERNDLLLRRMGSIAEADVLFAVAAILDHDPALALAHRQVLMGVVTGHATGDDADLVRSLLVRLGTPDAEVSARLEEIGPVTARVRSYRTMYRIDPGTATGVRALERLIWDGSAEPGVRHEAMQKAILTPPASDTFALHRRILAGEHRTGAGTVGPDAYQIKLMAAYGAASCEEALLRVDERSAAPER